MRLMLLRAKKRELGRDPDAGLPDIMKEFFAEMDKDPEAALAALPPDTDD